MRGLGRALQTLVTRLGQTILGVVAGFSVLGMAASIFGSHGVLVWILAFLASPVFAAPAVFIHEAGHAIMALRFNWIVLRFVVWPIAYTPRTKSWSLVSRPFDQGEIGGWVLTRPREGRGSSRQEAWITFGGVLANIASALIAVALSYVFQNSWVEGYLMAFAVFSVVVALTNLIPWKIGQQANDGLKLWRLWRATRHRRPKPRKSGSQWNVPRKW